MQIAAEMAAHPDGDVGSINRVFAEDTGYATPKLVGRAAVFNDDGHLLMVRETVDGRWTVPGGWIDVGESPSLAIEREVLEETGYRVEATKVVAVLDKLRHGHPPASHHAYLMFMMCDLLGGEARPSIETSEVGWFPRAALPELSIARTTAGQLDRLFEHRIDPLLPTDFD